MIGHEWSSSCIIATIDLILCSAFLAELSKPGILRPSKSNSRHLIRRACFNLPKLASITAAQSSSSLTASNQPGSPSCQSTASSYSQHPSVDAVLSAPVANRKSNSHEVPGTSQRHQPFFTSLRSKDGSARGVSPRVQPTTAANNVYNPASIEKL